MTLLSVAEDGEHGLPEQRVQPEDDRGDDADSHQHDHRVAGHRAAVGPVHLPELGHDLAAERADAAQPRAAGALLAVPRGPLALQLLLAQLLQPLRVRRLLLAGHRPLGLPVHCEGLLLTPRRRSIVEGLWQARRDSNPQPPVLETGTLPIELLALGVGAPSLSPKPNEYTTAQPAAVRSITNGRARGEERRRERAGAAGLRPPPGMGRRGGRPPRPGLPGPGGRRRPSLHHRRRGRRGPRRPGRPPPVAGWRGGWFRRPGGRPWRTWSAPARCSTPSGAGRHPRPAPPRPPSWRPPPTCRPPWPAVSPVASSPPGATPPTFPWPPSATSAGWCRAWPVAPSLRSAGPGRAGPARAARWRAGAARRR